MLLMGLHVLFGVTAIIGVLIAHVSQASTAGTAYHSHLRWLIVTFWVALAAYAAAFCAWSLWETPWPVFGVALWVGYRLLTTLHHWRHHQPLNRHW